MEWLIDICGMLFTLCGMIGIPATLTLRHRFKKKHIGEMGEKYNRHLAMYKWVAIGLAIAAVIGLIGLLVSYFVQGK